MSFKLRDIIDQQLINVIVEAGNKDYDTPVSKFSIKADDDNIDQIADVNLGDIKDFMYDKMKDIVKAEYLWWIFDDISINKVVQYYFMKIYDRNQKLKDFLMSHRNDWIDTCMRQSYDGFYKFHNIDITNINSILFNLKDRVDIVNFFILFFEFLKSRNYNSSIQSELCQFLIDKFFNSDEYTASKEYVNNSSTEYMLNAYKKKKEPEYAGGRYNGLVQQPIF